MEQPRLLESTPIDVAALIAGVIAVIASAVAGPEPYNVLGFGVGLTTGLVTFGYVWRRRRDWLQSVAFASVAGGIAIPVVCFFVQILAAASVSLDALTALLERDEGKPGR
jgi:hypothetical protein